MRSKYIIHLIHWIGFFGCTQIIDFFPRCSISYSISNEQNTNNQIAQLKREMSGEIIRTGILVHTRTVSVLFAQTECEIRKKLCSYGNGRIETKNTPWDTMNISAEQTTAKQTTTTLIYRHEYRHAHTVSERYEHVNRENEHDETNGIEWSRKTLVLYEWAFINTCECICACVLVFRLQFKCGLVS